MNCPHGIMLGAECKACLNNENALQFQNYKANALVAQLSKQVLGLLARLSAEKQAGEFWREQLDAVAKEANESKAELAKYRGKTERILVREERDFQQLSRYLREAEQKIKILNAELIIEQDKVRKLRSERNAAEVECNRLTMEIEKFSSKDK